MLRFRHIIAAVAGCSLAGLPASAADSELVAEGRTTFAAYCSSCHGADGTGHGPKAETLSRRPSDLTRIAARQGGLFPADRVFETIAGLDMPDAHGSRDMPVWGDVFVSEAVGNSVRLEDALKASDATARRIEALVAYLRSIQTVR